MPGKQGWEEGTECPRGPGRAKSPLQAFWLFFFFCLRATVWRGWKGGLIPSLSSTVSLTLPRRQAKHSLILLLFSLSPGHAPAEQSPPCSPSPGREQLKQKGSCQRILFQLQHSQTQSCSVCEGAGIEHLVKVRVKHINGGSTAHFIKIPNL